MNRGFRLAGENGAPGVKGDEGSSMRARSSEEREAAEGLVPRLARPSRSLCHSGRDLAGRFPKRFWAGVNAGGSVSTTKSGAQAFEVRLGHAITGPFARSLSAACFPSIDSHPSVGPRPDTNGPVDMAKLKIRVLPGSSSRVLGPRTDLPSPASDEGPVGMARCGSITRETSPCLITVRPNGAVGAPDRHTGASPGDANRRWTACRLRFRKAGSSRGETDWEAWHGRAG